MNARQKAKRYKRLYESLLPKMPVKVKLEIDQHKIDTIRFEHYYPRELILGNWNNDRYLREVVIRSIADGFANCLTDNLDKYVNYYVEYFSDLDKYHFIGEIKVIERESEVKR